MMHIVTSMSGISREEIHNIAESTETFRWLNEPSRLLYGHYYVLSLTLSPAVDLFQIHQILNLLVSFQLALRKKVHINIYTILEDVKEGYTTITNFGFYVKFDWENQKPLLLFDKYAAITPYRQINLNNWWRMCL